MNTAKLELCKELYELSGWDGGNPPTRSGKRYVGLYPAYDAGYLLRKLNEADGTKDVHLFGSDAGWSCWVVSPDLDTIRADTPEDALAKLCVELIKAKVITI